MHVYFYVHTFRIVYNNNNHNRNNNNNNNNKLHILYMYIYLYLIFELIIHYLYFGQSFKYISD